MNEKGRGAMPKKKRGEERDIIEAGIRQLENLAPVSREGFLLIMEDSDTRVHQGGDLESWEAVQREVWDYMLRTIQGCMPILLAQRWESYESEETDVVEVIGFVKHLMEATLSLPEKAFKK